MKKKMFFPGIALVLSLLATSNSVNARESDGMPIDEPITDSIKLDYNTSYIFARAMSRVRNRMDDPRSLLTDGIKSLGSIIVEPGANVGDITLIFIGSDNVIIDK
ncbi:MAG: hypothetical protein ABGY96_23810 [bacterium]|nr:hypothetical protein [Gammaproteobacteria bacterium]HIL95079.1 hypothetical protein [Pseudomonadales bacterium]